jgi:regulatory protein
MDLLARREHSLQELNNKLKRRFSAHPELLSHELGILKEQGLQSDSRMVEAFIRSRVSKGQGPARISAELRGKGIADSSIENGMQNAEVDWDLLAQQVAERKFGNVKVADFKEKGRRARFLQQRGFSFEQIGRILA